MIVADTCLIVHLFNETDLTKIAQEVLEKDSYWIVPSLWKEEYANVLSKLARMNRNGVDEVIQHFNNTVSELKNFEKNVDIEQALRFSLIYKISVYDAHFVALAIEYKTLLITEDKEILKNCSEIALNMKEFLKPESVHQ